MNRIQQLEQELVIIKNQKDRLSTELNEERQSRIEIAKLLVKMSQELEKLKRELKEIREVIEKA